MHPSYLLRDSKSLTHLCWKYLPVSVFSLGSALFDHGRVPVHQGRSMSSLSEQPHALFLFTPCSVMGVCRPHCHRKTIWQHLIRFAASFDAGTTSALGALASCGQPKISFAVKRQDSLKQVNVINDETKGLSHSPFAKFWRPKIPVSHR